MEVCSESSALCLASRSASQLLCSSKREEGTAAAEPSTPVAARRAPRVTACACVPRTCSDPTANDSNRFVCPAAQYGRRRKAN